MQSDKRSYTTCIRHHQSLIDRKTKDSEMKRASLLKYLFAVVVAFAASPVFAAINGDGLLNDVTNRFLTQSATWGATITTYATWLFWVLATISMVWTFGMMALRKADIAEFFAEFIRFTVTTGFFWWLLSNGPTMAMAIINSLRQIGATAGGIANTLTPSTPISIGFDIVKKAFTGLSWVHPIDNLAIVLVSAAVVVCMAVVAANVLIALVTAWTMAYAGTFILGFGGARWTSDMAISYFKAMLGIGLELMTMTLLVGIATSVIDGFYNQLDGSSVYELLLVFCVCAVLALLINKIPGRVAALSGGGSGASVGAGSVLGAAAMGAAAVATAGAALAAGASGMAGGAQALMAAFSKANASESGGSGGGGGTGDLMAAAGGGGGGDSGGGGSGGGSALASAMGDSGGGGSSSGGGGSSGSSGGSDSSSSAGSTDSGSTGGGGGGGGDSGGGGSGSTGGDSGGSSQGGGASAGSDAKGAGGKGGAPGEQKSGGALAAAGAAAAKVGRVAAGTAANLAQGSWDVAKAKASDMKDAAMERIGETTGGKIAAAIKARDAVPESGSSSSASFGDNSLSAGTDKSADADSEVAAFRDRNSKTS
jgi:type IV secretion system protein TrbL